MPCFFYRTLLCLDIIHCSILTRVTSPDQVSRTNRWTRSSIRISLQQFCRSFIWSSTCGTQNTIISAQSCTCKGTLNSAQSYTWKSAQSYTFKPAHSFCFYCFSFMFLISIYELNSSKIKASSESSWLHFVSPSMIERRTKRNQP